MQRKELRVILISLIVSFILTGTKFLAWFLTHSVAILSDALESIINVVAGAFACYSIYLTSKPKDENHPYGHGKVEFFSIGFEGAMIFIAGCLILFKAAQFFFIPSPLESIDKGLWIIGGTALGNLMLGAYLLREGKQLSSLTITGNGSHIMTDVYSSAGLVVALLIIHFTGWVWIDPLASALMGSLILRQGYRLLRQSISGLMDETDMQMVDKVIRILEEHRRDKWIDIHNMRVQQYGNNYHIDCHLTLPYYLLLNDSHEELKAIENLVNNAFTSGEVEFFIHTDPCIGSCCHYCHMAKCAVRQHEFTGTIPWTRENVLPNRKHGEE
ncbi:MULTISPECIES: cation diffusion facilitator family transporter [unclassified Chitinophaga]|uniref:cation diffusion facilitator family transporter n=1 Tax=unclassified Chitinophaga TaxID=2619133 RepID=UPI0009CD4347|nr:MULTISPECIES: cation diffusion facilitator family transporter [unclassified Chitinophaga]OMP74827.1 cation diffusion facilitator family transporter [[Flexibacter] sp. ATCC 35208]WPV65075.1 cation diffusion facilitator family transporter [Chitinophaga sp. LS1]